MAAKLFLKTFEQLFWTYLEARNPEKLVLEAVIAWFDCWAFSWSIYSKPAYKIRSTLLLN